jgi:xanthine dehydrogenase accessory factor
MTDSPSLVLLRGGGDLATGVAARLWRSGFRVVVTEIEQPLAVRRLVSLAEAIYEGKTVVEDLRGKRVEEPAAVHELLDQGMIPVLVDPTAESRRELAPAAIVDARMTKSTRITNSARITKSARMTKSTRMTKSAPSLPLKAASMMVGLGPGFTAGADVHAVVETNRGHRMGRVIWEGSAQPDTGVPDPVNGQDVARVLRAPADGMFEPTAELGSLVASGERVAEIDGVALIAPFDGALRGLLHSGIEVNAGVKVGDLDPRGDLSVCSLISDKSLAVGGGVLEALLSQREIRKQLSAASK